VPSVAEALRLRLALAAQAIDASIAERAGHPYVAVWSDRADVVGLVHARCPAAVPVNLDHVPLPRRGESRLAS
jgi:hypothetical protein